MSRREWVITDGSGRERLTITATERHAERLAERIGGEVSER